MYCISCFLSDLQSAPDIGLTCLQARAFYTPFYTRRFAFVTNQTLINLGVFTTTGAARRRTAPHRNATHPVSKNLNYRLAFVVSDPRSRCGLCRTPIISSRSALAIRVLHFEEVYAHAPCNLNF